MRLSRKPRPVLCDRPRCVRRAVAACSNGPQRESTCGAHVQTLERLWGQVFVRGLS